MQVPHSHKYSQSGKGIFSGFSVITHLFIVLDHDNDENLPVMGLQG